MLQAKTIHNLRHACSSLVMLLALVWLTVSVPFVYDAQQQLQQCGKLESYNPFANTTEEKTETGVSTFSEYLHDAALFLQCVPGPSSYVMHYSFSPPPAFDGELISPPPEA